MYDPPAYVWAVTVAGPSAVATATCLALYSGAVRAGLGRKRAALLGGAAAVLLGGWPAATAVIAGHGWYRTLPWFPIAVAGFLGTLLALRLALGAGRRSTLWFNALHLTSLVTFARAPQPASSAVGPLFSRATPRAAVTPGAASRGG